MKPICSILIFSLMALAHAAFGQEQDAVPAWLVDDPAFETMSANGFEAGDRGAEQPNRFDEPMAEFLNFTEVSQNFILSAFTVGRLTQSPNAKSLEVNNGVLAIVLIDLVGDMETLAKFVETGEFPESEHLPRVDTTVTRLLRKYPDAAEIITPDMQARIADLEAEVDRVLLDGSKSPQERLAESRARLATSQARLAASQAELDRLRTENEALRFLEGRMQSILDVVSP